MNSKGLLMKMQRTSTETHLEMPFKRIDQIRTAFDQEYAVEQQTIPLLLTLLTLWGNLPFQVPYAILPEADNSIILGQMSQREVLCVDAIADSRWMLTGMRRGNEDGEVRMLGDCEERLDLGQPNPTQHSRKQSLG